MVTSIDMVIALLLECIIFLYYTNTVMEAKGNTVKTDAIIVVGYIILYIVSCCNIPLLNAAAFVVINACLIYFLFKMNFRNVIIHVFVLTALMMTAEAVMSMLTNIGSESSVMNGKSAGVNMLYAVFSKMIYFFAIIITQFVSKGKTRYEAVKSSWILVCVPIFTILSIMAEVSIIEYIGERQRYILALIASFGIIANIILYWVYDRTLLYYDKLEKMQKQQFKNDMELNYCNMLEEKLQKTRIMRHDFNEHLNILGAYVKDNKDALNYLKSIKIESDEVSVACCTSKRVLNLLLSQKQQVCKNKNIAFEVHASNINMDFIEDIDVVSIFSNLLNNAIESSEASSKPRICVNIYTMNDSYLIIKVENSCDKRPTEENSNCSRPCLACKEQNLRQIATYKKYYLSQSSSLIQTIQIQC